MTTIPARLFSNVIPEVVAPAGSALATVGLLLSTSRRVPIGTIATFASAAAVAAFFGASSPEALLAPYYFSGFTDSDATPGSLLMTQFPVSGMPAWLQGGNISGLTVPQLQGISGTLSVVMDGYTYSAAALNLSAATSFSSAAGIIQTALNASLPAGGTSTASTIAAQASGNFTASIAGNILYVTTTPVTLPLQVGAIVAGTGVSGSPQIVAQLSGTAGGIGTYAISGAAQTVASESMTATWGLLTIGGTVGGQAYSVGQTITGGTTTAGTQITALGTGTGAAGTYIVTPSQTVASGALNSSAPALVVTYDSVSGGILITSGFGPASIVNGKSTAAYATGTTSTALALTQAAGATISNGGAPQTPSTFMNAVTALTTNWFSFTTAFDPDNANGAVGQNTQKMAFASWTSQQQDTPFAYVVEDTDISPSTTVPASSSMGQLLAAQNLSGTCPIWNPNGTTTVNANPFGSRAMFAMGCGASVDWQEVNGRVTLAYKSSPAGLLADVTSLTVATNLAGNPQNPGNGQPTGGNGYNYYGVAGAAAQNFIFFYPGSISGGFKWFDGFENQAFFNTQMQLDVLTLMTTIKSFPYSPRGYTLLSESLTTTIQQMIDFGAIAQNVPLSGNQIAEVNNAAGINIASVLATRGWYLQILPAAASVRAARGSPPCKFWYTDGGSIQAFTLQSIDVL